MSHYALLLFLFLQHNRFNPQSAFRRLTSPTDYFSDTLLAGCASQQYLDRCDPVADPVAQHICYQIAEMQRKSYQRALWASPASTKASVDSMMELA
jgi:hypothetical protein